MGKIWRNQWTRLIGSVIAVARSRTRPLLRWTWGLMACDPRTPPRQSCSIQASTKRECAHRELSYSWEAGRANVSGTATRLPGVSGRVALWSRIKRGSLAIEMAASLPSASVWWLLWQDSLEILLCTSFTYRRSSLIIRAVCKVAYVWILKVIDSVYNIILKKHYALLCWVKNKHAKLFF